MILAYAGVHRLGLGAGISQLIPFDIMLPAVGQGAVAIEVRGGDAAVLEVVQVLTTNRHRFVLRRNVLFFVGLKAAVRFRSVLTLLSKAMNCG